MNLFQKRQQTKKFIELSGMLNEAKPMKVKLAVDELYK